MRKRISDNIVEEGEICFLAVKIRFCTTDGMGKGKVRVRVRVYAEKET